MRITACGQRLLHFELWSAFWVTYYGFSIYILHQPVISPPAVTPPTPVGDYAIGLEQLASMSKDQNISALQQYGGASLQHVWLLIELLKCFALLIHSNDILFRLKAYQI